MSKEDLSRREFLKLGGLFAASLLIPIDIQQNNFEEYKDKPFPFINQENKSQCAIASMAMLIASYIERNGRSEDIHKIYDQVLTLTTQQTGREISPVSVGVYGNEIIEILDKAGKQFNYKVSPDKKRPHDPKIMSSLLRLNGPAIIDVNVNYSGADTNHWIVAVDTKKIDDKYYINIADPFRSKKHLPYLPTPSKTPKDMVFKPDGTIYLPWDTFTSSAGSVFIQLRPNEPQLYRKPIYK